MTYEPLDVSCTHGDARSGYLCAAQARQPCRDVALQPLPPGRYHAERIEAAAGVSTQPQAQAVTDEDFDRAAQRFLDSV